ncbi:polar amino acid transport system substrate-binding protein [Pelomonas saccharophila]|uniref:Polar amino acid transport system substrate-binding protein n=1 Tax=Roseateles saccharophilus TaxID=304 RepID=A0ABU1YIX7_ROSSA|nr:transporter substrate-binding domain-containing protein [Roseateles saccharophilus]MDR7268802.1 polar amino acid transport system substrate-binding protein [Roseateles saccharophilus]
MNRQPLASTLRLAAAIACLALSVTAAQAQTVSLCMTDFPPYVSVELPDGGSLTALARRAFTAAGLTVQTQHVPWVRAFALAKNGDCMLMTMWRNEERDALFRYSLPVARMQLGFFVRSERKAPLPLDATVAYQRGSYLPPQLTTGRYKLHELIDPRPGLEMLSLGRVDAVFSERATFEYQLARQPGLAGTIRWQTALEVKPTFMAISKNHPQADAWLELLNQEIKSSIRN